MATYHGVPAAFIADSILAAKAFTLSLASSPDEDFNSQIKTWMAEIDDETIVGIRQADNNRELTQQLYGVLSVLSDGKDFFTRHGQLNTDGNGSLIARALTSWGAFDDEPLGHETALAAAIRRHLREMPEPTRAQEQEFEAQLPAPYIRRYGVVIAENENGDSAASGIVHDIVWEAMEEFAETGDSGYCGRGADGSGVAVSFETSFAGACDIVGRLPEGCTVIDADGRPISEFSYSAPSVSVSQPVQMPSSQEIVSQFGRAKGRPLGGMSTDKTGPRKHL